MEFIRSNFHVLEHSGDLKLLAIGQDYLEALACASSGLVNEILNWDSVREEESLPIQVQGNDETDRTIAFLNEIIFLIYTKNWIPKRVQQLRLCSSLNCNTLQGYLSGEPFNPERHLLKLDIKAITYHQFEIVRKNNTIQIQFICDL